MLHKAALHFALLLVWSSAEVPSTAEVQADQPQKNVEEVKPENLAEKTEQHKQEDEASEEPETLLLEGSNVTDEEQESTPEDVESENEPEENPAEALLEDDVA